MSYILDALRRADAERERGAVPSLQSQQHTIADDDAAAARPRSLLWVVVALAVALVAVLAWSLLGRTAAPARAPVEGSITTQVPAPLPALQPAPALPAATATAPAVAPSIAATPAEPAATTAASPPPATPAPAQAAAPPAPPRTAAPGRRPAPAPTPAAKRVGDAAPAGAAPAGAEPRIYAQSELPEEIRRDLPKIVIGGSSYSSAAPSRMVMVNGQVFHEGDRLAPDLVLERIRLKSAVFAFKGWRYEVLF
ncbi:MAG TPA: general secretion pathway protein GspB [Caldimonas sp.]|nr:general secretion pathway protein GspB [Caldimonas sp.]